MDQKFRPGDKAFYVDDVKVIIVQESHTPGIYYVRYEERDSFGDRAGFHADEEELIPRKDV